MVHPATESRRRFQQLADFYSAIGTSTSHKLDLARIEQPRPQIAALLRALRLM